MWKRTWGITFAVLVLILAAAAAVWYVQRDTPVPPKEQRGTELVEMLPARTNPDRVSQTGRSKGGRGKRSRPGRV